MTLSATLSIDEAADRCWDVLVVGAGPAGALAARELARRGTRVLLVDRSPFPRSKVCGSCLNGRALATLTAVGLGDLVEQHGGVALTDWRVAAPGRSARVPLPCGRALSREVFDAALVESALAAGSAFLPRTRASLDGLGVERRRVLLRHGEQVRVAAARLVLAADGLGGQLAGGGPATVKQDSRIGAGVLADGGPGFYGPGTIFMACGPCGYVGVVRLEDGRLDIAAAFDPVHVKRCGGPGPAAVQLLAELDWPAVPNLADLAWRGTPGLTRRPPRRAAERLFVLGDAAGYVEPFTGEGIAWALTAAAALAPLAARAARRWEPGLIGRWEALYRRVVGRRQFLCRLTAQTLRQPVLLGVLVAGLARAPWLAAPVVRFLNAPWRFAGERGPL